MQYSLHAYMYLSWPSALNSFIHSTQSKPVSCAAATRPQRGNRLSQTSWGDQVGELGGELVVWGQAGELVRGDEGLGLGQARAGSRVRAHATHTSKRRAELPRNILTRERQGRAPPSYYRTDCPQGTRLSQRKSSWKPSPSLGTASPAWALHPLPGHCTPCLGTAPPAWAPHPLPGHRTPCLSTAPPA
eukprot:365889-Chlamydomonas_euryale.AAC.6